MHSLPRRILAALVTSAVLLSVGFMIGRWSMPGTGTAGESPVRARSTATATGSTARSARLRGAGDSALPATWQSRWDRLRFSPPSPANDRLMAGLLEELALADPGRALAMARKEQNRLRRDAWIAAVARVWSSQAPNEALRWLATQSDLDRETAEAAVMDGAATEADSAVAVTERLLAQDPPHARAHVGQLLRALAARGDFAAGVDYSRRLSGELRTEMLGTAFQYWAQSDPEHAFAAGAALADAAERAGALEGVASAWAQVDPAGLSNFASRLGSSEDRGRLLGTALREWVRSEPVRAIEWLDQFAPGPDFDAGAEAVASAPALVERRPDVALSWAASITNAEAKSHTVAMIVRNWAERDATAALNYVQQTGFLTPDDRNALLSEIHR